MLATIITLTIIVGYFIPVGIIQPKLALHNYNRAGTNSNAKDKASIRAFWQALLWPVMVVVLQGHNAIHEKLETEKAIADTRKEIADRKEQQKLDAFAEFDKELGVRSHGVILAKHLKSSDVGRTITYNNPWEFSSQPKTVTMVLTEYWMKGDSVYLQGTDTSGDRESNSVKLDIEIIFH